MNGFFIKNSDYRAIFDQLTPDEIETLAINTISWSVCPAGFTVDKTGFTLALVEKVSTLIDALTPKSVSTPTVPTISNPGEVIQACNASLSGSASSTISLNSDNQGLYTVKCSCGSTSFTVYSDRVRATCDRCTTSHYFPGLIIT